MSGKKVEELAELDACISKEGFLSSTLHRAKRWLMSHSRHLNFPTILLLASVRLFLADIYLLVYMFDVAVLAAPCTSSLTVKAVS